MLTDEELIQQIGQRLHEELEVMYPADRVMHVWEEVVPPAASPATAAARARRRRPNFRTSVGVAATFAAAAVVVVGALALFGGAPRPAAQSSAARSSERPLLRILGVLRHPQTSADLSSALRRALGRPGPTGTIGSPDLAGVRLAGVTPAGEQVFLVPFKPPTVGSISAYLSQLPAGDRARARAALESSLPALDARGDSLGIVLVSHGRQLGEAEPTMAWAIEHGRAVTLNRGYADLTEVVLVVPDGVSKVSLLVPNHRSTALNSFTGSVHNNIVVLSVPSSPHPPTQKMVWYGPTGKVLKRFGDSRLTPPPPASSVRAPITVHVIKASKYCYKRLAFGGFDIPCDHGVPRGYKPARGLSRSLALVDISFTARLAADNHRSVYEFSYARSSGPAKCTLNTGGTSGTTMLPVRAGQRLTLQDTQEVCPGTYEGVISYQPNGGPGQDMLNWGSPITDGSVLVGRFRYVIRAVRSKQ